MANGTEVKYKNIQSILTGIIFGAPALLVLHQGGKLRKRLACCWHTEKRPAKTIQQHLRDQSYDCKYTEQ
jgi:hypothetical protein